MRRAIELAVQNVRMHRGGPFAALVVRDGEVVATGTNLVTANNDPTAHAEIVAIRQACAALAAFQLTGCDIYATSEPCPMCLGAIYWARPARLFFGATREDAAEAGFDDRLLYEQIRLPYRERSLPSVQLMRAEALEAFREWSRSSGKIPY